MEKLSEISLITIDDKFDKKLILIENGGIPELHRRLSIDNCCKCFEERGDSVNIFYNIYDALAHLQKLYGKNSKGARFLSAYAKKEN